MVDLRGGESDEVVLCASPCVSAIEDATSTSVNVFEKIDTSHGTRVENRTKINSNSKT